LPTAEAYRYYVEQLSGEAHLSHENQSIIQEHFDRRKRCAGVHGGGLRNVLSLISHGVGVTVATSGPRNALEHVYFSRLGDAKVLAVVVARSGVVPIGFLRLDIPQSDLDFGRALHQRKFSRLTMSDMRAELARRLEQERSEYDRLMKSLDQLYKQGALAATDDTQAVFVEGAANLVTNLGTNQATGEEDRQRLQEMLRDA